VESLSVNFEAKQLCNSPAENWFPCKVTVIFWFNLWCVTGEFICNDNNNNNIRLLKTDKPQLNTEMLKVTYIVQT